MSKRDKDYIDKIKKKLDDMKFKTPSKSKDPKFVQKELKNINKIPKKLKNKKEKKSFLKDVVAKIKK
jgi:predicted RNase H-like nuclease (RuvC/YqgF family)